MEQFLTAESFVAVGRIIMIGILPGGDGGLWPGGIAGTMAVTDPALVNPDIVAQIPKISLDHTLRYAAGALGASLVSAIGKVLAARRQPVAAGG